MTKKLLKINSGFTLIELLVVITIMGILAMMTMTGFTSARKSARDATRKSDIDQYRTAIEGYAANHAGDYPTASGVSYGTPTGGSPFDAVVTTASIIGADLYLPTLIKDPTQSTAAPYNFYYGYIYDSASKGYVLYARLETGGYWMKCSNGKTCLKPGTVIPIFADCNSTTICP